MTVSGLPDSDEAGFIDRVIWIVNRSMKRVVEHRAGVIERYAVLLDVGLRLGWVPLEADEHEIAAVRGRKLRRPNAGLLLGCNLYCFTMAMIVLHLHAIMRMLSKCGTQMSRTTADRHVASSLRNSTPLRSCQRLFLAGAVPSSVQ